ncbi:MAG: hypothetical protein Q8K59_01135 [Nitrosomonas sp.]|nr:hypothetical protein [Nitrosomonas sp.]MDP1949705.1 hypothetical protein [Nitrosomonas sp.]
MIEQNRTSTQQLPSELIATVASQCRNAVSEDFLTLSEALIDRFGPSLDAVILYGSCLHSCSLDEGIADLYAVVDNYRDAYSQHHLALLNAWLPPNVFYLEVSKQGKTLRAKYAVISLADFEKGARDWFHPYIWARFAQPARILYVRDEANQQRMYEAIAHAVVTFLRSSIEALGPVEANVEEIWASGLMLTYAAELRTEQKTRARHLAQSNLDDYTQLTTTARSALAGILEALPNGHYQCLPSTADRRRALRRWRLRRWQGRILSILRLTKATITFRDCLDYAAWKIERHTGVHVEITPMLRRHPVLWGYKVMWQLLRRGVLR